MLIILKLTLFKFLLSLQFNINEYYKREGKKSKILNRESGVPPFQKKLYNI